MSNWFEHLKVNDHVIVSSGVSSMQLKQVAKLTKTMIVLNDNQRFRLADGNLVGGSIWSTVSLLEATPELIHTINIRAKRRQLQRVAWDTLDEETVEQVFALIKSKNVGTAG